jgi:hypothetical protein
MVLQIISWYKFCERRIDGLNKTSQLHLETRPTITAIALDVACAEGTGIWTCPGGNPGANLKSISHRCHPILVACVWELTRETITLPITLGCLQGGHVRDRSRLAFECKTPRSRLTSDKVF